MSLQEALAVVKTAGYRVSRPRAATRSKRPGLNAIGLPMSPLYDPKYKIKTPLTSIRRLSTPQVRFPWKQ